MHRELCSLLGEDGLWMSFLTAVLQVKVMMVLALLGHKSYVQKEPHKLVAACSGWVPFP